MVSSESTAAEFGRLGEVHFVAFQPLGCFIADAERDSVHAYEEAFLVGYWELVARRCFWRFATIYFE
ncbi:hypothetical protein [Rubritalea tangerina]|uniref:hypothetical protein n=1 Tax=Rubritalea tangerina TaxID=430798 RepID=UPI0036174D62